MLTKSFIFGFDLVRVYRVCVCVCVRACVRLSVRAFVCAFIITYICVHASDCGVCV